MIIFYFYLPLNIIIQQFAKIMDDIQLDFEKQESHLQPKEQKQKNKVKSQYLKIYQNSLPFLGRANNKSMVFQKSDAIHYDENKDFTNSFSMRKQLNNKDVFDVRLSLGRFQFSLKILECDCNSLLSKSEETDSGNYGKVYNISLLGQKIAVKSYPFERFRKSRKQLQKLIEQIATEYCISKLSSAL